MTNITNKHTSFRYAVLTRLYQSLAAEFNNEDIPECIDKLFENSNTISLSITIDKDNVNAHLFEELLKSEDAQLKSFDNLLASYNKERVK